MGGCHWLFSAQIPRKNALLKPEFIFLNRDVFFQVGLREQSCIQMHNQVI